MANLSPEERDLVTDIQASLASAKSALQSAANKAQQLAKINRDGGRLVAGNAAMRLQGALVESRGKIIGAHADASDALIAAFDDGGGIVIMGGGGR